MSIDASFAANDQNLTLSDVHAGSEQIKGYYDDHGKELPENVEISGSDYNLAEFLDIMARAAANVDSGDNSSNINARNVTIPVFNKTMTSGYMNKDNYIGYAWYIIDRGNNNTAEGVVNTCIGNMDFNTTVWMFSKILVDSYDSDTDFWNLSAGISVNPFFVDNVTEVAGWNYDSFSQSMDVNGFNISKAEFLYLMSKSVTIISENNSTNNVSGIIYWKSIPNPPDVVCASPSGNLSKSPKGYLGLAWYLAAEMSKGKAPSIVNTCIGPINFETLCDVFVDIIKDYIGDDVLPDVAGVGIVNAWHVKTNAELFARYFESTSARVIPIYVHPEIERSAYMNRGEYLYLMARTIVDLSTNNITSGYLENMNYFITPQRTPGSASNIIRASNFKKKDYVNLAHYIVANGVSSRVQCAVGFMNFDTMFRTFVDILANIDRGYEDNTVDGYMLPPSVVTRWNV